MPFWAPNLCRQKYTWPNITNERDWLQNKETILEQNVYMYHT